MPILIILWYVLLGYCQWLCLSLEGSIPDHRLIFGLKSDDHQVQWLYFFTFSEVINFLLLKPVSLNWELLFSRFLFFFFLFYITGDANSKCTPGVF